MGIREKLAEIWHYVDFMAAVDPVCERVAELAKERLAEIEQDIVAYGDPTVPAPRGVISARGKP